MRLPHFPFFFYLFIFLGSGTQGTLSEERRMKEGRKRMKENFEALAPRMQADLFL